MRRNPELLVQEVHGNVDSRIRKIKEGEYDALVLAFAGIKRLGLANYVAEIFPEHSFYPAPGQGAIAIQSRAADPSADEILEPLNHAVTMKRVRCERAFLKRLEGGCQLPCGITTSVEAGAGHAVPLLRASGGLYAIEDHNWAEASFEGPADHPEEVGENLADLILRNGGREILEKIRKASR